MCQGCGCVWTSLHVLWSVVYVSCGAAQLVAGIFFLISLPELHLSCHLWTGSWNIVVGIGGGMLACFGQLSQRRQEFLLYMTISILTVNSVNTVLSEWAVYYFDLRKVLLDHPYRALILYACFVTRIAAVVVIIVSFLDSQLTFCSMQTAPKENKRKAHGSHEQVSDIEYIIPRQKPSKPYSTNNAYAQSWVFDADSAGCSNHADSPYLKLPSNGGTHVTLAAPSELDNGSVFHDTTHLIDNPVVHVEEASDDNTSNSNRKFCYLKSFSRSASPIVLSASSSQLSLNMNPINPPINECLEKLTEPTLYRSRLNTALSNKEEDDQHYQAPQPVRKVENRHGEKVHYASLMKELQRAIVNKKETTTPPSSSDSATTSEKTNSESSSRHDSSRTDGKNSDAEFSKELEAALQLIQDLESPNTIETPSETKSSLEGKQSRPATIWRVSDASEDDKTLSAVGSLAELTSPMTECQPELCTFKPSVHGKGACVVVQYSESQSTSGYSSPTHKSNVNTSDWSTTSSVSETNSEKNLACTIHNTKSTAVISLHSQDTLKSKGKCVTLVTINGDNDSINEKLANSDYENKNCKLISAENTDSGAVIKVNNCRKPSIATGGVWNVKSLLRKKKSILPKLCPELEGAIFKSESLAYLTELELLARHQRSKEIQRQIEQRVLHQMGSPRTESNC